MKPVKFAVTSPVRTAQIEEEKFVLYNTRNYKSIFVKGNSYQLW